MTYKEQVSPFHSMQAYRGGRGIASLDGGEWLASSLGRFTPGKKLKGGWEGVMGLP